MLNGDSSIRRDSAAQAMARNFVAGKKPDRRSVRIAQGGVSRVALAARTNRVGQNNDMGKAVRAVLNSGDELWWQGQSFRLNHHAATKP